MIIGAGLGGALMACFLGRAGYRVSVHERRADPRIKGFVGGRSINLALSARGIHALQQVGLAERVLADAVRMPGRMIHSTTGAQSFQPYSSNPNDAINSVSRGGLNITLLQAAARHPNVQLYFDRRCAEIDLDRPAATFLNEQTGQRETVQADVIIGADGAFSAVRDRMHWIDLFDYSQEYLEHGYKELTIPPTSAGDFAMQSNALHIWPRGGSMMIALPNKDRSFTCTLFWPYEGEISFGAIRSRDDILPFFQRHFPDAVPLMPTLVEDYQRNPVGSLLTIRCRPWHHRGKVVLLGDAAHAIVPFYGQGMNAAFEDCVVLDECIRTHPSDLETAFRTFEASRRPNTDAIAEMALDNFIEMRDHTASKAFRARKKMEHALHRLLPRWFMPLYDMISFSTIPYAEARLIARRQRLALKCVAAAILAIIIGLAFAVVSAIM